MNKLRSGEVYTAVKSRKGQSRMGNWELLLTTDERGKNDIAIFVRNLPSTVNEGDTFRIDRILSVSNGFRKGEDDKWQPAIAIDADVTVVERAAFKPAEEADAEMEIGA